MCHFLYVEDVLKDYYGGKYTISLTDSKSRWLFNKTSIICLFTQYNCLSSLHRIMRTTMNKILNK